MKNNQAISNCKNCENCTKKEKTHKKTDFKIGDNIQYMGIDGNTPHPEIFEVTGFHSTQGGGDGYLIKNNIDQIDFCYGDNYIKVDTKTDNCSDIKNHISPNTKVIEK